MMYPLVRELAAADAPFRVPVAVTCRVLKLARQPYYPWLARPVTDTGVRASAAGRRGPSGGAADGRPHRVADLLDQWLVERLR